MDGTFTTGSTTTLTLADLERAADAIKALGPEPFREYMRKQGFDPKDGCYMVLPECMRKEFPSWGAPEYVRFSKLIDAPVLIRDPMHDFRMELREAMRRAPADTTGAKP